MFRKRAKKSKFNDLTADMLTSWNIVEELYEEDPMLGLYAALNLSAITCARQFIKVHEWPGEVSEEVQKLRLRKMYLEFLSYFWNEVCIVVKSETNESTLKQRWQIFIPALSLFVVQANDTLFPEQETALIGLWLSSSEKFYPDTYRLKTLARRLIDIDMNDKGSETEFVKKEKALLKLLKNPIFSNFGSWSKMPMTQYGIKQYPPTKLIL